MQTQGFVALVSISASLLVVGIMLERRKGMSHLYKELETADLVSLNDQLSKLDIYKVQLENLLSKGTKIAEDEEKNVEEAVADVEKMKTEITICQEEKETKAEELAGKEHEHTEIEANLKSEHDAWNQEIANLRAQATGYRQICDFVKDDPTVKKMCGTKQETLLRRR
ncbi:uncharacterized protein LOC144383555 isoform X1 [Gasterosteus aculeatus]|uniref:Uncharacterized protein n=1 Tax=Gasterosteus aculeatus TaxID=69293 RepID=G3NK24_GASAC